MFAEQQEGGTLSVCDTTWNCMSLCNCSHQFCKNILVSFDFIITWNQGVFLCSLCTFMTISSSLLGRIRNVSDKICRESQIHIFCSVTFFKRAVYEIVIIINIKDWTLWSFPSPGLQLLAPTLLRSSNCSPSLWSVVVWFQRDSVLWHSLKV